MKVKLSDIIANMKRYRGKPVDEPLTEAENFICFMAYSVQGQLYPNFKPWANILNSSHT